MKDLKATDHDGFAVIRDTVAALDAKAATARLIELFGKQSVSYYELGALLHGHRKERIFSHQDFRSFIEQGLREDYDRMNRVLHVCQAMAAAGLSEADARGISFSAMYNLIPLLRKGNYGDTHELLKFARVNTVAVVKARVREIHGRPSPLPRPDIVARLRNQISDFDRATKALVELSFQMESHGWEFSWTLRDPATGHETSCDAAERELSGSNGEVAATEVSAAVALAEAPEKEAA